MYYKNLQRQLEELFGTHVKVASDHVTIEGNRYRVDDDVIILKEIDATDHDKNQVIDSFGREWKRFSDRKPEHEREFADYFDLVDLSSLSGKRCADFGCGMGRWSQILLERTQVGLLVAVDYSDAIFVARDNLRAYRNVVFIKADLETLTFAPKVFDFSFCLGVLHHIPRGIEAAARNIANCSRQHLCYLYYNFEDHGLAFRTTFKFANSLRLVFSTIRQEPVRVFLSHLLTVAAYYPFIATSAVARMLGRGVTKIPLHYYSGYSYERIRQDAYDRFFTPVEYRFNRHQIDIIFHKLYSDVTISDGPPYWHFLCR